MEEKAKVSNNEEVISLVVSNRHTVSAGKPYQRGRLSTINLLVLTGLDQLLFILKIVSTFLQKKLPQLGGLLY